ncbi:F-box protein [Phytophthora citrophthora]|uniref:F-box protein n=1 Tax=Phytophthora citrophthora TaxID=4793 RepID=A0AAD9H2U5_9STRA|nr:F-box protein [Phytophthora citrophthora]
MAASAAASCRASRTIELLAPVYEDVCQSIADRPTTVPVTLKRTADDWIQLVFLGLNVRKDVACVNGASGCRCDFVRLLRALLTLTEQLVLQVDATYVLAHRSADFATLQMRVQVHEEAKRGTSLRDFDLVLCHLQATVLSVVSRNGKSKTEARYEALESARSSSCHVVGCRLHPWDASKRAIQPKQKLNLPDVFHSLTSQMEVGQMEIRDDVTYVARMTHPNKQVVITDLPTNVLQSIVCLMNARDLSSLSGVCSLFQHMAYEVVPGLNLVLYEHQRRGLKWMLRRETPSLTCIPQPHPFILSSATSYEAATAVDLIEDRVIEHPHVTARDACGGMFCDEPGLGKTITMLALILRTKGQTTDNTAVDTHGPIGNARPGLRSSRSRGRSVNVEDLVSSGASLIVVPDPLVEHWKYQVEAHVAPGALRVFVDPGVEDKLPYNIDLATYDVVITSFTRLAREWRLHRPTSALEERMPERYGFEGPQRYADGTIRGEVSSLLTVHWVRVIVDEGHKLGGQTPSDLMQLARLLCAERRWVMTGTPTPNTLQSADLRYMHGLLVFLRNQPYGNPDGQAWIKAIARPFERNEIVGFYRLQHLLSRIMMRHTKESICEILPEPVRRTVYIDPTPTEYAQYNGVAAAVRANLVITNMDPKTPGYQHPDSLLNPVNRKDALRVVSNLRSACCGGSAVKVTLAESSRLDTINMLNALNVDGENMGVVIDYLRKVQLQGMVTQCGCCKRKLQLLMIIPCGHLCCADCVEDRMKRFGPSCFRCNAVFDREAFQRLQPGFEFEMVDDVALEATNPDLNQNGRHGGRVNQIQQRVNQDQIREGQEPHGQARNHRGQEVNGRNGQNAPRQPRRALDLTRDIHFIDASKAFYAATRIKELKEEFLFRSMNPSSRSSRRQARCFKAIIFSQFKEHIWHTKVAFAQQGVPTADFIAGLSPEVRMKQLMRFRKDPNLNVLLLTEVGSHGLDLSFVTHIFLMDEIWDKSLEQQVISRAHRMGATQAVIVEQLWMRGSVESQMLRPQETDEVEEKKSEVLASPTRIKAQQGDSPGRSPKKPNTGGGTMFTSPSRKRKRNRSAGDARKVAKGNKNTFLQRKLNYVLSNLRLLGEDIVAETGQVRFFVEDEHKDVIRQAIHTMPNRGSRRVNSNIQPAIPAAALVTTWQTTQAQARRVVTFGDESSQGKPEHVPIPKQADPNGIDGSDSSSDEASTEEIEEDDEEEKEDRAQDENEAAIMMRDAPRRWVKKRRSIASNDNAEVRPPPMKVIVQAEVNGMGKMVTRVKPKGKAVSFAIIDDDDSDSD